LIRTVLRDDQWERIAPEAYGRAESRKIRKFMLRAALRPNQIEFSHSLGQRLPLLLSWQHVRCTPDSCPLAAMPKSAALGQVRTTTLQKGLLLCAVEIGVTLLGHSPAGLPKILIAMGSSRRFWSWRKKGTKMKYIRNLIVIATALASGPS
jgi:hypothetical protein